MELPYLHNQRQYILSSLSKTQIIMDGLQTKISDAERSLTTNSKRTLEGDSSSSSNNNETTPGLPRAQKKKLQQTRWRARTSLRNCESEQHVLFESLRQVQDRILRMQADILDKDAGPWISPSVSTNTWMPPSRPAAAGDHRPNPDPTAVMTAYAANFYASPYVANSPYAHYPHGIPPSAYLDPDTTPDDLWTWQANDTHGPYTALPPSLLSNDPYQYTYAYQQQHQQQANNFAYDYERADWDARGRKFSRAARSSYSAAGGPGPIEVVDEMGTHHYIYGDKGKDKEADADSSGSPSTDDTGRVAPGVFPEKWELGRPSLTVSIADGEGVTGPKDGGSGSGKAMAAVVVKTPRGHKREQSAALSPRTSVFVPGKMSHESSGTAAAMPTKSALATTSGGSGSSNAVDSLHHHHHPQQAHVHFAEPPPRLQQVPDPCATPFKAPSSPYPFARGDSKAAATKSQPYTPPHRRNSSLNSSASSASSFVSENGRGARKGSGSNNGGGGVGGGAGKRRYSAAAVDLILNRLRENEGKPRKRCGPGHQGHVNSKSADLDGAENRPGSGSSEADEGGGENRKRGREGVGWGSVDEPKYKVGGGSDDDVDMEGVD